MSGTKKTILLSALRLFSDLPYTRVSIRLIAHSCGVSHSLVHRYWVSKESLFQEVALHSAENLLDTLFPTNAEIQKFSASSIVSKLIQHRDHGFWILLQQISSTPELNDVLANWCKGERLLELVKGKFGSLASSFNLEMNGDSMMLLLLCTQYIGRAKQTCKLLGWDEQRIDQADYKLEACMMRMAWSFDLETPWTEQKALTKPSSTTELIS